MDKASFLTIVGCTTSHIWPFQKSQTSQNGRLLHQHLQCSIQRVSAKVAATVVAQGPIQRNPWRCGGQGMGIWFFFKGSTWHFAGCFFDKFQAIPLDD